MKMNQDFGSALKALKEGKRVARKGWAAPGLFVFMQVPATIQLEIIPKMTSLPQSVKDAFDRREAPINYCNQLALVKPDNEINGWAPSVSDALAEDWIILDVPEDPHAHLPPHQQRVLQELAELEEKRGKLDAFLDNPIFKGLSDDEKERLVRQLSCMGEYSGILRERISAFHGWDKA